MTTGRWLDDQRSAVAAEHLLDAAARLFAERGVASTGMGDVASAAGCSRATVYRYFESRRALHVAFVHRESRRIATEVGREVAPLADPHERLVTAVIATLRAVRADATLARWFSAGDAGLAAELAGSSAVVEGLAAAFLGDPTDPDVRARARWLVRVIVSLLAVPGSDENDERALVTRFVAPVVSEPAPSARG